MRNSRRKSVRNAIRKLKLEKNDIVVTNLPKELVKSLVQFLREKYASKNIALINLADDDSIEKMDLGQLIEIRMRCDKLINSKINEHGKLISNYKEME